MKKEISILGSTGSIGLSAIEIIKKKKTYLILIYLQQIKIINLYVSKSENLSPGIL